MNKMPNLYYQVKWLHHRYFTQYGRLTEKVIRHQGLVVSGGPFAGMKYIHFSYCSSLIPKLLGIYELELSDTVRSLIEKRFSQIINIGCAEGYYAVGFALRSPKSRIIAFEQSTYGRILCNKLARINGVAERISIMEKCDSDSLDCVVERGALIICDCEGSELELLDPKKINKLANCTILVEVHDCFNPTISTILIDRFKITHEIKRIKAGQRNHSNHPFLKLLNEKEKIISTEERKVHESERVNEWAFMVPRDLSRYTALVSQ